MALVKVLVEAVDLVGSGPLVAEHIKVPFILSTASLAALAVPIYFYMSCEESKETTSSFNGAPSSPRDNVVL